LGPLLEVLDDGRVRCEALLCRLANLAGIYGVGGNAFFFDKLLYLVDSSVNAPSKDDQR
jgi:hypothetical protein